MASSNTHLHVHVQEPKLGNTRANTLDYMADMVAELKTMADAVDARALASILYLAHMVAREQADLAKAALKI